MRRRMEQVDANIQSYLGMLDTADRQTSLTDPNARAMDSAATGTGFVGHNFQAAVDADTYI